MMLRQDTAADQILEFVRIYPGCGLDEVATGLHQWNWSEVFIEVDRLSRSGRLRLMKSGSGFLTKLYVV